MREIMSSQMNGMTEPANTTPEDRYMGFQGPLASIMRPALTENIMGSIANTATRIPTSKVESPRLSPASMTATRELVSTACKDMVSTHSHAAPFRAVVGWGG